jgi:hypothetical protein
MRRLVAFVALILLAGCTTGKDFARPSLETFRIGATTRADIVAAYGEPRAESGVTLANPEAQPNESESLLNAVPVAGSFRKMTYAYQDRSEYFWTERMNNKSMTFTLWNEALIAYVFSSDFPHDTSDFDSSKIRGFAAGRTTRQHVVDTLGVPTGRAVYPAVQRAGDEKLLYYFLGTKNGKIQYKLLEVLVDPSGTVADFRMSEDAAPVPAAPRAPVSIPVFIPTK